MSPDLQKRIERARELLKTSKHAAMATVNEDGSPHNTPFKFMYDPHLEHMYWGSHPDSVHSLNVARTGKIFVVLYDAKERGGLYINCVDAHAVNGEALEAALDIHNSFRAKEGLEPLTLEYYTGDSPQRMWRAKITNLWVNNVERGADGHISRDIRQEITAKDLLN